MDNVAIQNGLFKSLKLLQITNSLILNFSSWLFVTTDKAEKYATILQNYDYENYGGQANKILNSCHLLNNHRTHNTFQ